MQSMWLCIFSYRPFQEIYENTQKRKVKQIKYATKNLLVWANWGHIWNTWWTKVKQMQPMRQCLFYGRWFYIYTLTCSFCNNCFAGKSRLKKHISIHIIKHKSNFLAIVVTNHLLSQHIRENIRLSMLHNGHFHVSSTQNHSKDPQISRSTNYVTLRKGSFLVIIVIKHLEEQNT